MAGAAAGATDDLRFEIRSALGQGGTGVVYRAFDRRLGREVALKVLRHGSGRDLYRFKREFRGIADLVHPNLIGLHELHTTGDDWFFTMDLVDGVSFMEWVRPAPEPRSATWDGDDDGTTETATRRQPRSRQDVIDTALDPDRLRAALPQLVDGVLALHVAGKLHRDLKPSNVLVGRDGRVVVLDFGLIAAVDPGRSDLTHVDAAVGTPAYMSPEQASDLALDEASDWYAVGVMLYEALVGHRPFEGAADSVLRRKQLEAPPAPRALDPSVPADLDALCTRLLAIEPGKRPGGRAVLAALGAAPSPATVEIERAAASRPFVGRADELAALRAAFGDARTAGVAVFVSGDSGIGKSQLVRTFLDELAGEALVLEGRCFERESVPFRTLDTVVDALTAALLRRGDGRVAEVLPREVAALARLFPVLRRVPAIANLALVSALPQNPQELRRRGFDALREILGRLAADQPLVVAIDDLQWGDADSAVFLSELVHQPEPILLLLVHRREDDAGIVRAVRADRTGLGGGDCRALELAPLSEADARALVQSLGASDSTVTRVLRDAGGHPLFLAELARTTTTITDGVPPSLDELIQRRIARLPAPAAALLRTAAVAARPLPLALAARAADVDVAGAPFAALRAERLARVRVDDSDAMAIEPYHDRVRAAVVAALDPDELRRTHEGLARIYEAAGDSGDREALVAHWLAAGQPARAAGHAAAAAAAAEAALAFHRAADLYALALAHGGDDGDRAELQRRRAEALTSAGRLDEAIDAFGAAAAGRSGLARLELDRRRLEQILRRGRLAEGLALAQGMLGEVGIRLPPTRAGRLRGMVAQRLRLRLRGLGFAERAADAIAPEQLHKVDLLFSVATSLGMVEPVSGQLVQAHYLRAALDSGELHRACSALSIELGYIGLIGSRAARRVDDVIARVGALAERIDDPYVRGRATTMCGLGSFLLGRWREAATLCPAGLELMYQRGVGVRWDFDVIELVQLAALIYLGDTAEVARLVPGRLRDATERGDLYAPGELRGGRGNIAWLVLGRPDEARGQLAAVELPLPAPADFQLRHLDQLVARTQIELYAGDAAAAWAAVEAAWPTLDAALLLRHAQLLRIEARFARARAAIARALTVPAAAERRPLLAEARRLGRGLRREGADWAAAVATQVAAMVAIVSGDAGAAVARLVEAERGYAASDMQLHATVVRLRRGQVEGGDTGAAIADAARDAMRQRGIVEPEAMARMLCPWPA